MSYCGLASKPFGAHSLFAKGHEENTRRSREHDRGVHQRHRSSMGLGRLYLNPDRQSGTGSDPKKMRGTACRVSRIYAEGVLQRGRNSSDARSGSRFAFTAGGTLVVDAIPKKTAPRAKLCLGNAIVLAVMQPERARPGFPTQFLSRPR